tara:strand:- start:261 stop:1118 length:858 start_codon:yes stop_codon:yes gene_type:complete
MSLAIITQCVARHSILKLHCHTISKHFKNYNHYIYFPFGKENYSEIIKEYNIKAYDSSNVKWKRKMPDSGYGLMLNEVLEDKFIFLHDDVYFDNLFDYNTIIKDLSSYDFIGCIDSVSLDSPYPYDQVLYNNIPIYKLRIGTYFMCGDKNVFLSNNMSTGNMKYLFPILSNVLLNNYKLKIKKPIMVDGGFNFNFEILKNKYSVKRYEHLKGIIHMERFSTFFISRGLKPFDVNEKLWRENKFEYNLNKKNNDEKHLMKFALILEKNNIYDDFLNTNTVGSIFND